jgi:hypothetical protein
MSCPQCGAVVAGHETCEDRFNTCQLTELEYQAYYAVHHMSVPCYLLQHNAYSRKGWLSVRDLLRRFVEEDLTPQDARLEARIPADSGHRTWSFTKGTKLSGVDTIMWSMTIADVHLVSPERYCADTRAWTISILADTANLVRSAQLAP